VDPVGRKLEYDAFDDFELLVTFAVNMQYEWLARMQRASNGIAVDSPHGRISDDRDACWERFEIGPKLHQRVRTDAIARSRDPCGRP